MSSPTSESEALSLPLFQPQIAVAGVGPRFRLIFIVAQMVGHFGVECCLNADFFQQAIELVEIFRGFEIFGQFVSQSLQLFFVHKLTCF